MTVITRKTLAMEIEILKVCSLTAMNRSGIYRNGEFIATLDLTAGDAGFTGSWWVSGPNIKGELSMLFQAQVPIIAESQGALDAELFQFAEHHAFPIASVASKRSSGLSALREQLNPEGRTDLYLTHLGAKFSDHLRTNAPIVRQTIDQFYLAKSLNLGTFIRDIAKFQGASPLTVETRITRARKAGQIPKATLSSAADIKDQN